MCAMCHCCGSELVKLENDETVMGNENFLKFDGEANLFSCKVCGETQSSPHMTTMISPTISLSSSDSCVSSSSKFKIFSFAFNSYIYISPSLPGIREETVEDN